MSEEVEHDPLDLNCQCRKCNPLYEEIAAANEQQERRLEEALDEATKENFYNFIETSTSWLRQQVKLANSLSMAEYHTEDERQPIIYTRLTRAAEALRLQIIKYCDKCGVEISIRKHRSVKIALCNVHKAEHDRIKKKRENELYWARKTGKSLKQLPTRKTASKGPLERLDKKGAIAKRRREIMDWFTSTKYPVINDWFKSIVLLRWSIDALISTSRHNPGNISREEIEELQKKSADFEATNERLNEYLESVFKKQ